MGDLSKVQKVILGELRHQCGGAVELLSEATIPLEYKLFYLGLRALKSGVFAPQVTDQGVTNCIGLSKTIVVAGRVPQGREGRSVRGYVGRKRSTIE